MMYYCLSNGDYNNDFVAQDLSVIEWEIEKGQQDFVLVTKKKIDSKIYGEIQDFLCKKLKQQKAGK